MLKKSGTHAGICSELTALYERKNHDYGDSFGKNFAEYGNVYPIIHMSEKLDRLKTLVKGHDQKVMNESIEDTLLDLANYAIMTIVEWRERRTVAVKEVATSGIHYDKCKKDCLCTSCAHDNADKDEEACCIKHKRSCSSTHECHDYQKEVKTNATE